MHHTGTLFMSKTRPIVARDADGSFRLELALVDNMGRNPITKRDEKEAYRVRWSGPEAKAFWEAHQGDLTPGTPLHAELARLENQLTAKGLDAADARGLLLDPRAVFAIADDGQADLRGLGARGLKGFHQYEQLLLKGHFQHRCQLVSIRPR